MSNISKRLRPPTYPNLFKVPEDMPSNLFVDPTKNTFLVSLINP